MEAGPPAWRMAVPLRVLASVLLAALALAGCASAPPPVGDADAAHAGRACEPGQTVVGFLEDGAPRCESPNLAGFSCPRGEFVNGFGATGRPRCAAPPTPAAPVTTTPATWEVSSNLKVVGVYGARNDTAGDLRDVKVNVELSAGALPMDFTKLVIRWSDGVDGRTYAYGEAPLPDGAPPSMEFNATWIRGRGTSGVMQAGDLVQIHFNLAAGGLPPRTSVQMALIPEVGSPVTADFRTPATYGTDLVVTLR